MSAEENAGCGGGAARRVQWTVGGGRSGLGGRSGRERAQAAPAWDVGRGTWGVGCALDGRFPALATAA